MNILHKEPPRRFYVGANKDIAIDDCADVYLEPDEMVTFRTPGKGGGTENGKKDGATEFDVVRKSFGYYATPSLNGRLPDHGLRPALCANAGGLYYILLVEPEREEAYRAYLAEEDMRHVLWLDDAADLARLDG